MLYLYIKSLYLKPAAQELIKLFSENQFMVNLIVYVLIHTSVLDIIRNSPKKNVKM